MDRIKVIIPNEDIYLLINLVIRYRRERDYYKKRIRELEERVKELEEDLDASDPMNFIKGGKGSSNFNTDFFDFLGFDKK